MVFIRLFSAINCVKKEERKIKEKKRRKRKMPGIVERLSQVLFSEAPFLH